MLNMRVRGENEQEMAEKREGGPAAARENAETMQKIKIFHFCI